MRRLVLALSVILSGCVTAPTSKEPATRALDTGTVSVSVTVRVLTYETEQPIERAAVLRDSTIIGLTDAEGLFTFRVKAGSSMTLQATKQGFAPSMSALGEVHGHDERWTFYMEPLAGLGR